MRAVVVAAGDLDPADRALIDGAQLVVAADGGATRLDAMGHRPDLLVGDLDSVDLALVARMEAGGTRVERHPADKEASDTELAVEAARAAGATEVVLLGATRGTRLDHEVANLLLLAAAAFDGTLSAVHGPARVTALHGGGGRELEGERGDLVSLLPIGGDASGVSTHGLRWRLDDATLRMGRSRGLSNEIAAPPASVQLERGSLLLIETSLR